MINIATNQAFLPSDSQNYNPNIFPNSSKMLNVNLSCFQNINTLYSKSNSHKKINSAILTDQNVDINNIPKTLIDTQQIIKSDYHNAYSMNKNLAIKFASAQRIRHRSENGITIKFQNSAIKENTLYNT